MKLRSWLNLFLTLCLLILIAIGLMIFTSSGLQWSYKIAQQILPGQLKIDNLQGKLWGPLSFDHLQYHSKQININAGGFKGNWKPTQLIESRITIQEFDLDDLSLQFFTTKKKAKVTFPSNLDFSFNMTINDLSINKFSLQQDNAAAFNLENISLQGYTAKHQFILQKLNLQHGARKINLIGKLEDHPLEGQLNLVASQRGVDDIVIASQIKSTDHLLLINSQVQKPVIAQIQAQIKPNINWQFKLDAQWKNLNWPFTGPPDYSSTAGKLTAQGDLNHYQFNFNTQLDGDMLPTSTWQLNGQGNQQRIIFDNINADLLAGHLTGHGQFSFNPDIAWDLALKAKQIDLSKQWSNLTGKLNFNLSSTGKLSEQQSFINLQADNITGNWFKDPAKGYIKMSLANWRTFTTDTNVTIGNAKIKMRGVADPNNSHLSWDIIIPELHEVFPVVNGQLMSRGKLNGSYAVPNLQLNLLANQLSWQNNTLEHLTADGTINVRNNSQSNFTLTAQQLKWQVLNLDAINLLLTGTAQQHNLKLALLQDASELNLGLQGHYNQQIWQGTLTQLNLKSPYYNNWSLLNPTHIKITKNNVALNNLCWAAGEQTICGNVAWQTIQAWSAKLSIKNFALQQLNHFVNERFTIASVLNADLNLSSAITQGIRGQLKVNVAPGSINYISNDNINRINFAGGKFDTQFTNAGMTNHLEINGDAQNYIIANLNFPGYFGNKTLNPQQATKGDLKLQFFNLNLLPLAFPDVSNTSGKLTVNTNWNGTVQSPHVNANLKLDEAQFDLPSYNTSVTHINVSGQTSSAEKVTYRAQATFDQGALNLKGDTNFSQAAYPTTLSLVGKDLTLSNRKDNKIIVSPDLNVIWDVTRFQVIGKVTIPTAIIYYKNYIGTVTLPANTVIINATPEKSNEGWLKNFNANITLLLGNNVKFYVGNLVGRLIGQFTLNDVPNKAATASGEIQIIDGSYAAFGQAFKINNGHLLYAGGPLDNPGLNIRAIKQINKITTTSTSATNSATASQVNQQEKAIVGIQILGSLNKPEVSLFSDPAGMTQADILSYLVLGYSVQQASSGNNGQALWQALSTLQVGDDDGPSIGKIKEELQSMVGLDELTIQSDSYVNPNTDQVQGNTSLKVGKNITQNLSVGYSMGLLAPVNTISANYKFWDNWMLSTTSNSLGTGADIIYARDAG